MAIYQRGKNFYIDFRFKGKRIRECIGPSRKDAEKVIAKRKTEIIENKYLDIRKDPEPIKFHEFAKEYLEWGRVNHKPSSRVRELSNMRTLEVAFNNKNIHEITVWDIEKWKVKRKGEVKPSSVNRELATLKGMLNKAVEWGKLKESHTRKIKLLKGVEKRLRYLMPDEVQILISNCTDRLRPIVVVAVHTGMRKGEILSLRWDQVDFEKGIITLVDTKNDQRRYVPMDETVKSTLRDMSRNGEYVFPGIRKQGSHLLWVDKMFRKALEKSGIEDFKIHDLRHTFASNLVMSGKVDLMTVKELLGHKKLDMTLRYAHLAPNHKMRAVNVLDQVLSETHKVINLEEVRASQIER